MTDALILEQRLENYSPTMHPDSHLNKDVAVPITVPEKIFLVNSLFTIYC